MYFRVFIAVGSLVLGLGLLVYMDSTSSTPVSASLLALSVAATLHLLVDVLWERIVDAASIAIEAPAGERGQHKMQSHQKAKKGKKHNTETIHPRDGRAAELATAADAIRAAANLTVSTAGIVLGLIAAFSSFTTPIKIGSCSLAVALALGLILFYVVSFPIPASPEAGNFVSYLFNLTALALFYGVFNIAFAIAL